MNQPRPLTDKELAHKQAEALGFKTKEVDMTNRERAEELLSQLSFYPDEHDFLVELIERALDEAEKRGHDFGVFEGQRMGRYQAQWDMRERAAQAIEGAAAKPFTVAGIIERSACVQIIRSLPIEGEK